MRDRIDNEATPREVRELWSSAYVLLGLRYETTFIDHLLKGVLQMRESTTYQAILEEGRTEGRTEGEVEGERRLLLVVGERRLGKPTPEIRVKLLAIDSRERLEFLATRLFEVETWDDLLDS